MPSLQVTATHIHGLVLGQSTRAFNTVFAMAQNTLRKTFGMELVELMSRAEREKEQNDNDETREGANATGLKKKGSFKVHYHRLYAGALILEILAASAGAKTYILRSTLDPAIIEATAATDEQILEDEILEIPEDEEDEAPKTFGSILSWSSADELGPLGILYVLLALILVSGGALGDSAVFYLLFDSILSHGFLLFLAIRC